MRRQTDRAKFATSSLPVGAPVLLRCNMIRLRARAARFHQQADYVRVDDAVGRRLVNTKRCQHEAAGLSNSPTDLAVVDGDDSLRSIECDR